MTGRPTGTVTFLFTDIEGSTRLWEEQPEAMALAVSRHDALLREAIGAHGGYVFTTAGDAFSAAFADPGQALDAAVAAQLAIGAEPWPVGELRVRMGLHAGTAHERDGDYFGPVLNRTARIMSAGHGGQVLASRTVVDLVQGRLGDGLGLRSLGEHRLKDLGAPELLHEVVHPGLRSDFPPLRTLEGRPGNLPAELTSFIGRADELAATVERLERERLVTLTGVGGSGKTRLALQAAAETVDRYPDGIWFVELAPLRDPEDIAPLIAESIGVARGAAGDRSGLGALELAEAFLGPRTSLLVLDNCEHLIGGAAGVVDRLLRKCPDLCVLATSREGLGIVGEHLVQVPSMRLPAPGEPAEATDAVQLFAERAAAVGPFQLTGENIGAVSEICRRLDGMPLAIELAAARTRMFAADELARRLEDAFRLLTGGSRTALPRQQTLAATIDWSYRLLTDVERIIFDRLAVFRGGFRLDAAEAVLIGDGVDAGDVFDSIASMVDKSMVQRIGDDRFGLLETVRQFARERLVEDGDAEEWRRRHAEYFASVADEAHDGTRSARQVEWLDRLDADHDNIKAALDWSMAAGEWQLAARIADGAWWFWGLRGHAIVGLPYLRALRDHLEDLAPASQVGILTGLAYSEFEAGDVSGSLPAGEAAVERARVLGDDRALALALLYFANTAYHNFARFDDGRAAWSEGYRIAERLGWEWAMGWHALNDGWVRRWNRGQLDEAEALLRTALSHFESGGIPSGASWGTVGLGLVLRSAGRFDEAEVVLRDGLRRHVALGNGGGELFARLSLVILYDHAERFDDALAELERAREVERRVVRNAAIGLVAGRVHRHLGQLAEAHEGLAREVGDLSATAVWTPDLFTEIGMLAVDVDRPDLAAPLLAYGLMRSERYGFAFPDAVVNEWAEARSRCEAAGVDWSAVEAAWSDREEAALAALAVDTLAVIEDRVHVDGSS